MAKDKKLAFLIPLMVVLLIAIAYEYGYKEVQAKVASLKEEQREKAKMLMKYITLIEERPAMEKKLAQMKEERKADDAALIEGQTLSIVSAALQDTVKGMVSGRGGKVISERSGKPGKLGDFTLITTSIDVMLPDTRALSEIMHSIATQTPYLVVRELNTTLKDAQNPRELIVKLDVAALTGGRK